ncbi:unnamed protein product [Amoebophrya sp. A120]|nr:unnamed protein product [Amoebophrya sp. A120]|eukprot:GSA120T00017726001.1
MSSTGNKPEMEAKIRSWILGFLEDSKVNGTLEELRMKSLYQILQAHNVPSWEEYKPFVKEVVADFTAKHNEEAEDTGEEPLPALKKQKVEEKEKPAAASKSAPAASTTSKSSKQGASSPKRPPAEQEEEEDEDDGNTYIPLDSTKRVSLSNFKGRKFIDIREYYQADGEMKPGKKGISLTKSAFDKFVEFVPDIDAWLGTSSTDGKFRELDNAKRVSYNIFKGKKLVDIREYYQADGYGSVRIEIDKIEKFVMHKMHDARYVSCRAGK